MAEQAQARAGGCLCGAVRYRVHGPLRGIHVCHCGQCRRVHGYLGAYTSAARTDVDLEGADALRWFATSARGRRGFCGTCGSSLFFEPAGEDRLAIVAGSLDQPSGLEVLGHEHVADQADYVRIDDDLPAFPGDFGAKPEERA
ncbi:MAG: GFA family protein [Geminicoccales bacterium]